MHIKIRVLCIADCRRGPPRRRLRPWPPFASRRAHLIVCWRGTFVHNRRICKLGPALALLPCCCGVGEADNDDLVDNGCGMHDLKRPSGSDGAARHSHDVGVDVRPSAWRGVGIARAHVRTAGGGSLTLRGGHGLCLAVYLWPAKHSLPYHQYHLYLGLGVLFRYFWQRDDKATGTRNDGFASFRFARSWYSKGVGCASGV